MSYPSSISKYQRPECLSFKSWFLVYRISSLHSGHEGGYFALIRALTLSMKSLVPIKAGSRENRDSINPTILAKGSRAIDACISKTLGINVRVPASPIDFKV